MSLDEKNELTPKSELNNGVTTNNESTDVDNDVDNSVDNDESNGESNNGNLQMGGMASVLRDISSGNNLRRLSPRVSEEIKYLLQTKWYLS